MRKQSKLVSFRLGAAEYGKLVSKAKAEGQSPGGFAREALLAKLAGSQSERSAIADLQDQVKRLRSELALATESILTLSGHPPITPEEASDWVRKNLNR